MKKNKKGFTLVELIVVMALMSVIMMAIMYIMGPARKYYARTENNKNEEAVCIGVSNAISDELKYATNIHVSGNSGMPSGSWSNLIIIDNISDRPGSKKKAKGYVTKSNADGTNSQLIMGEAFYGEDEYKIQVSASGTTEDKSYITLSFTAYPLSFNGSSYVKGDTAVDYNLKKSIEFTNINNKNSSLKIKNSDKFSFTADTATLSNADKIYIYYNKPV
ncbi:MAG: prepilin-type N-terminal cleavage/methylation domain-containing protein [Ruminococcus sp.]|nr:prepilin-type N-terminal cleavage/methylation domain-containing protein [Ruminococcus sp.]